MSRWVINKIVKVQKVSKMMALPKKIKMKWFKIIIWVITNMIITNLIINIIRITVNTLIKVKKINKEFRKTISNKIIINRSFKIDKTKSTINKTNFIKIIIKEMAKIWIINRIKSSKICHMVINQIILNINIIIINNIKISINQICKFKIIMTNRKLKQRTLTKILMINRWTLNFKKIITKRNPMNKKIIINKIIKK